MKNTNKGKLPEKISYNQRIREKENIEKFQDLKIELKNRTNNRKTSKQATGLFMLKLAHQKLMELDKKDKEIQKLTDF